MDPSLYSAAASYGTQADCCEVWLLNNTIFHMVLFGPVQIILFKELTVDIPLAKVRLVTDLGPLT